MYLLFLFDLDMVWTSLPSLSLFRKICYAKLLIISIRSTDSIARLHTGNLAPSLSFVLYSSFPVVQPSLSALFLRTTLLSMHFI